MMATTNSQSAFGVGKREGKQTGRREPGHGRSCALRLSCFLGILSLGMFAQASSATRSAAAAAESALNEAQARLHKNVTDPECAWQFARACFDLADLAATSSSRRAEVAEQGIAAVRRAIERDAKLAPAHYYLAMNIGQLARTKKLGALKLLGEMETEFKAAIALDPKLDYAGAHRSLGLLYLDAPGWPASIGNRGNARSHLRKAVELSPEYPENFLSLLDAYLKWGEKAAVQAQLASTEDALQKARKVFTGEKWDLSWEDWDRQWQKIKTKAGQTSSALESPRQKR